MRIDSRLLLGGLFLIGSCELATISERVRAQDGTTATADIKNPADRPLGRADFTSTPNGVIVHLRFTGAPSGVHALHVHETGRCEAPTFESAGGHYNPTAAAHGFKNANGPHVGDLPSVHIPSSGTLEIEYLIARASLTGGQHNLLDEDGSALVLHTGADDYRSEPAGDAGRRAGCGVLQASRR